MKIQTKEALVDRLLVDLSWRKKELTVFREHVGQAEGPVKRAMLRASVAFLYAHWEGYIKNAVYFYICYVAGKHLRLGELCPEMAGLALRAEMNDFTQTGKAALHGRFVEVFRDATGKPAKIPTDKGAVRTKANLNFDTLADVLCSVGCEWVRYEKYRDLVDDQLVETRNKIAHGEQDYIDLSTWEELQTCIMYMMEDVTIQIMNAADQGSYRAAGGGD